MGFWLDAVALGLLATFAALGARRGTLATGLSLLSIVAGYAAAWLAATHLGGVASDALGVSPLVGVPLAGTAGFLLVMLAVALFSLALRGGRANAPTAASRVGGALFGAARGSLLALAIGLLALWLDAYQKLGAGTDGTAAARAIDTPLRVATRAAVEAGVQATLGAETPGAALAAHALSRPAEAIEQLRAIVESPEVAALAQDAEFWGYVESGALGTALTQPSFLKLQWNSERRRELAAVGLVDDVAAGDPALFALALRGALAQVGPRLRALREDPELAGLASDPAVADLVARRDMIGLLTNPRMQRLLGRL